jgi:hypothetical protein
MINMHYFCKTLYLGLKTLPCYVGDLAKKYQAYSWSNVGRKTRPKIAHRRSQTAYKSSGIH